MIVLIAEIADLQSFQWGFFFSRSWYSVSGGMMIQRFNMLRNYSRKKNVLLLVKQFEKLKSAGKKQKKQGVIMLILKKMLFVEGETFKDLQKLAKLRTDKHRKQLTVSNIKKTICGIPIIPVVIPKVKYVKVNEIPNNNEII